MLVVPQDSLQDAFHVQSCESILLMEESFIEAAMKEIIQSISFVYTGMEWAVVSLVCNVEMVEVLLFSCFIIFQNSYC